MALIAEPIALWVVPVPDLGGVARHVLDTAREGIPGWRLVVLCPEGPLAERLRAQGTAVTTGSIGPDAGLSASVRTLKATARALRPAIVHSHLAYADIVVAATSLPRGTRRFTTEHGIAGDDAVYHGSALKSRIMSTVHHVRLRRFDGVIAVSDATKQAMLAKWRPRQQVVVIRNGVDAPQGVKRRKAAKRKKLRILSLSRLSPEKRIDTLIEAFAIVLTTHPDAVLTIAGTGPLDGELKAQAARLGLGGSVVFAGFVDPEEAMAGADVIAQLSVWENCSYTLLDAVARGLRVVASDVGGNREIVPASSLVADPVEPAAVAAALTTGEAGASGDDRYVPDTVGEMTARIAAVYRH